MNTTPFPPVRSLLASPRAIMPSGWLGRPLLAALAAGCLIRFTAAPAAAAGVPARTQASQQLAVLASAHGVRVTPQARSPQISVLAARRPITGEQTTLPVLGRLTGPEGLRWLRVMLPGRPNGSTGWIVQQGTRELVTRWHISVDLTGRRVKAYRGGRIMRTFQAVVGKPSTPTPTGAFFVEETLQMSAGEAGGPFALALSARSDVLQEFEGGPGQIAMHGRDNLGGTLGAAESHGCIRIGTEGINWLAARIGPGTPVTIYAR
jgi:lipoprotein-anchoring transpeptidase ErfK/SrfK